MLDPAVLSNCCTLWGIASGNIKAHSDVSFRSFVETGCSPKAFVLPIPLLIIPSEKSPNDTFQESYSNPRRVPAVAFTMLLINATTPVAPSTSITSNPATILASLTTSIPSPTDRPDPIGLTVVFGILGLLVGVIGVSIAVLQLRRMSRRAKVFQVFELACKTKFSRVGE
jgi:hypothetical protein